MATQLKQILVIGGTGAQGIPVVQALALSNRYAVRVLTRNAKSKRAQELATLPNVTFIEGTQDNQTDLHAAFRGVDGAFVNFDGFSIGERNEVFYGIRAYEIARHEGVKHYIWASIDYSLKKAGWDEQYHCGHNDGKGRIADFILSQGQEKMLSSIFTTGPYMDMLFDGMFVPETEPNGDVVWANPAGSGKIPLIALEDVGHYVRWMFDNPQRSSGMQLEVATDEVSMADIAETFTRVTGRKGIHRFMDFEPYVKKREPYPGAPANFTKGPNEPKDPSQMTWGENFTAWWKYWGGGFGATRDFKLLDEIHPGRIKNLEEWMRKVNYQGARKSVLKDIEDSQHMRKPKI
ncbi:hypothetical protein F5884DRAFT_881445 [Xylogone sp. PMI_703]|nr:hypothetical protein F5884DRAFT_881445 [Xylogone sp. PMI_703]